MSIYAYQIIERKNSNILTLFGEVYTFFVGFQQWEEGGSTAYDNLSTTYDENATATDMTT